MLHDRRSGAEKQVEKFKMPQEVSRKVECLDSRGNAHFGSADREIAPRLPPHQFILESHASKQCSLSPCFHR
jgi:hypothetical protein